MNDVTQATRLTEGLRAGVVVGDRAYDCDAFLAAIAAQDSAAVVPSRARRRVQRPLDVAVYATRNVIERFFGRIKQSRRVGTRYDKMATSYGSFVAMAALLARASGWRG